MDTEANYDESLSYGAVGRRTATTPRGVPAVTGYYPNVRGSIPQPITIGPVYDELYRPAVVGANDPGEVVDQHPWTYVTQTWVPPENFERPSGVQDPLTDGPPQPVIKDLALHYRRQSGSSNTQYYNVPGRKFPVNGSQDGAAWTYYQDTTLAMMPYDPAQTTGGQMPDTLRGMPPSPAHGWAVRPLVNAQAAINAKTAALTQQQPTRQERLANSTYAGQTYSQTTARAGMAPSSTHSRRSRG
ncbi:MAG: hypothetical protein ACJ786_36085 [Catenulispora sp.]|jgi:hypothetical protein